jgi:L-lactate dehydrogenase complex protein LldG
MSNSSARNKILNKIRTALKEKTPKPFPLDEMSSSVFQPLQQDIVIEFAEQFTQLQGKFIFCTSQEELKNNFAELVQKRDWTKIYTATSSSDLVPSQIQTNDIITCDAAVTDCEALVARTGSIVLSSENGGRITSVYAPVHICIAYTSQLVYDINDAFTKLGKKYGNNIPSSISLATGPSRTADIEKTLVVGVHGPKEVYCFLIDDMQGLDHAASSQ